VGVAPRRRRKGASRLRRRRIALSLQLTICDLAQLSIRDGVLCRGDCASNDLGERVH